ncbi:unnamed protein product [Euphydryas editha]|uniref:unspecific monooxygenase n=1 Tax=Euphydryas editha TaxID=104508 RepID=A0AAU9TIB6_EUPED|nr:unnamed protein product [Euphydryas editha]
MYVQLVSAVAGCILFWLYLRWLKIKRYWADRGVPHLPPLPILGSLTFLQKENISLWLRRLNEHFNSPYFGIWVFWRPGLVINSPEIARKIVIKDFDNFRNRFLSSGKTDPIGGLNLFTVNDPIWSAMRRNLSSVFTAAKLRIVQDYTRTKAKELVQRIHNDRNVKIDLKKMYIDYTTDIIGTSAFGVKSEATLTGVGPLRDVTNEFSTYNIYRGISWCSIFFFPELVDIFRFKFFPQSSVDYFKKIFHTVVAQRKANKNKREAKDLLDLLIEVQEENKTYTDELILSQAAIFLLGGFETSASIMTFTTYELAHNLEIQDKLYEELSAAAQRYGNDILDIKVLSELTYLDCVVKEGLRKYATMGWLDRVAINDYKVDDKLTIEAGTVVYVNSIGMHYDPKFFPEPNKFDPDRFLPENRGNIVPYSYMPFGEGPRFCVGKRFGMMTVQFGLASVVLNYKIRPCPNMPQPSDIKINCRGLLYLPGETLNVEFIPRNKV